MLPFEKLPLHVKRKKQNLGLANKYFIRFLLLSDYIGLFPHLKTICFFHQLLKIANTTRKREKAKNTEATGIITFMNTSEQILRNKILDDRRKKHSCFKT